MSRPPELPTDFDDLAVFRTLFAAYPDGLLLVDAGGHIVLANPAAAGLLGYLGVESGGLFSALDPSLGKGEAVKVKTMTGGGPLWAYYAIAALLIVNTTLGLVVAEFM